MKKFLDSLLNLIYRKKCYFCGKSKFSVKMCPSCFEKLEFKDFNADKIINNVDVYCAGIYTKNLQKLIRGLKYHKQKSQSTDWLIDKLPKGRNFVCKI